MHRLLALAVSLVFCLPVSTALGLSLRELQFLEDPNTHAILHAAPARDPASTRNVRDDECSAREDLTGPGRLLARKIGETIQKAGTRIDHVVAGPECSMSVTARLLQLVPVDIRDFLAAGPGDATAEEQLDDAIFYLAGLRPLETALLVTDGQNIALLTGVETVPGQLLIVEVSPLGEVEVLYSITP